MSPQRHGDAFGTVLVKCQCGTIDKRRLTKDQKSFMNFILHEDFSDFSETTWNALVQQSIADTPFSRHEYLSQWWKTLGGREWERAELVLVSATENDQLVGIAPLFITEYDGQQALMLVGSIEISDYLDLIVSADDLPRFLSGLLDFLASRFASTGNWS